MMYDHTDADVPMMRSGIVPQWQRDAYAEAARIGYTLLRECRGAIGFDENGDHYVVTYPPRGMRCS